MTLEETFFRDPWGSLAFYAQKARWFFGPVEVPSSASLATDLGFSPGLRAACVPVWLVASLAVAGAWAWRRRADVLLGPGALALAHLGVLTLVFPLSHYRAPAIPALAVLAGGAVAAAWSAWDERRRGAAMAIVGIGAAVAAVGAVPPRPDPLWFRDESVLAMYEKRRGNIEAARTHALAALEAYRRQWPGAKDPGLAWELIAETQWADRRWEEARASLDRSLELDPHSPTARMTRSWVHERLLDFKRAEEDARETLKRYPFLPDAWVRLGEVLSLIPGKEAEAAEVLREAIRRGGRPDEGALRRAGLPPLGPDPRGGPPARDR
jgi:tetratricopeptide (TPR) repeat protein